MNTEWEKNKKTAGDRFNIERYDRLFQSVLRSLPMWLSERGAKGDISMVDILGLCAYRQTQSSHEWEKIVPDRHGGINAPFLSFESFFASLQNAQQENPLFDLVIIVPSANKAISLPDTFSAYLEMCTKAWGVLGGNNALLLAQFPVFTSDYEQRLLATWVESLGVSTASPSNTTTDHATALVTEGEFGGCTVLKLVKEDSNTPFPQEKVNTVC